MSRRPTPSSKKSSGRTARYACAAVPPTGSVQRVLRRQPARAPDAVGWDELPWMKFPTQPRRQFLRFAQTVRELGCVEDEVGFERLLAKVGTHGIARMTENQDPVSSAP